MLLHLNILLAMPLKPAANAPPPDTIRAFRVGNNSIIPSQRYTGEDVRLEHYEVPHTNIDIDILLFLRDPMDREALGLTLRHGISWTQARIENQGDAWLAKDDDPFYSTAQGKCFIRIDAQKTASGRSMMTYKTLLAVFLGLWNALFLTREEWAVSFRFQVAGMTAGHGAIADHSLIGPAIS